MDWKLADAKNRFSEVVDRAISDGPQHVTRRGEPAVVVVSAEEFEKLQSQKRTFKDLILNGPDLTGVDLSRNRMPGREYEW